MPAYPLQTAMTRFKSLPLLLYSYIATEMLAPFFASFIILCSVFFLVRLVPLLDVVLELRIGLADFIRLTCYIFPYMLLYVIPMSAMTGIILCFTRMSNEREILVLKACGVSLRQLLPPVILLALTISLLTGFFSVRLIPAGETAMKQLMFQLAKEKIDKGLNERTFTEALGDLVVYADTIDENDQWHGVYVSDMRNREIPIIIMARSGNLAADLERMVVTIVLRDGTLHNMEDDDNQVIRFNRYQVRIPLKTPTMVDGRDVTRLGKGSMTQAQLLQAADSYGRDTRKGVSYLTEYHHRLALPVGCLVLSLLGLPLGLLAGPGRRVTGPPMGLAFFVLYYILSTTGRLLAEDLVTPAALSIWAPNLVFLVITFFVSRRVEQEKPILPEQLMNELLDIYDQLLQPVIRTIVRLSRRALKWRPGRHDFSTVYYPGDLNVHASAETRIYHVKGCSQYGSPRCTIQFKNCKLAEANGFAPCPECSEKKSGS